jgi:hypothetical protein
MKRGWLLVGPVFFCAAFRCGESSGGEREEIREQFSRILFPEGDHKIADVLFNNFAVQ